MAYLFKNVTLLNNKDALGF